MQDCRKQEIETLCTTILFAIILLAGPVFAQSDTNGVYIDTLLVFSDAPTIAAMIRLIDFDDAGEGAPEADEKLVTEFARRQNHRNPFESTTMKIALSKPGPILPRVFNLLGRNVAVLKDGFLKAGYHRLTINKGRSAPGTYFTRLETAGFVQTRKLMLLKQQHESREPIHVSLYHRFDYRSAF